MKESLPGEAFSEEWRFALPVENFSKWQDTVLGHWKLGTGYWTFVFQPPLRGHPDASRSSGGACFKRRVLIAPG